MTEMACPWCQFVATPRALHAHLGEQHATEVRFEQRGTNYWYGITCPRCGDGYEHLIKPRSRDPAFVEEFQREIRLVAFDMLVNHLIAEHEEVSSA